MRVPVDWLGEYVTLREGDRGVDIASALVRVGLEEEGLHSGDLTGPLVVGRVLERTSEEQKNGRTINWCRVDVGDANGTGEPQGIVCGAHNFDVGDLVPVILPGGVLPGGLEISARRTYGHVSAGMICSTLELGLGQDHEGILVLSDRPDADDLVPGQDAVPLLGLDRETVEVNVTPDRGYCFSVRGVAREYGHATGAPFADPARALAERAPAANETGHPVRLEDEAPIRGRAGCGRYVARVVRGIDVGAPTPAWMATRLREAGMRPISLPVDVTNYVMLGLGQPLHAFDAASLRAPIVVRRARAGERLTTLDDVERALSTEDLMITEGGERLLAIAGVMGGEDSEVTDRTTDVLIEAAHFDQVSVARSARRHRLPSEASRRFERGVDPQLGPAAAQLAAELLVEHGGGTIDPGVTDVGDPPAPPVIDLPKGMPSRIVGVDYGEDAVERSLSAIGCTLERGDDLVRVTPPSWRPDLRTGEDLVEEVARLEGYEAIPSVLPTPPGGRGLTHGQSRRRLVADVLAAQGLSEVWAAPFVGDAQHVALGLDPDRERAATLTVANPLSDEQPLLRTRVLTTLVEALHRNVWWGAKDVALFEVGLVVQRSGDRTSAPTVDVGVLPDEDVLARIHAAVPHQPRHLAFVLAGDRDRSGWWGPGRPADLADALEITTGLGQALALRLEVSADDVTPYHPGRCARVATADGTLVGHVGELHPKVVAGLGLPERTVAGELDLDVLTAASGRPVRARTLSSHPLANTDVALVVDEAVPAARVAAALRSGAGDTLEELTLFDVYRGDQVGEGRKSLAYRLTFRADRTLTTDEVSGLRDEAVGAAGSATGAQQR